MVRPLEEVDIREFDELVDHYLPGAPAIAVRRNGRVVGFYVPMPPDRETAQQALDNIAKTVERIRARTGMSEVELADLFDLEKPLSE